MTGNYYLGVDVGTGSARVCVIDDSGEIKGLAVKDIKTWNEKADYYVGGPEIQARQLAVSSIENGETQSQIKLLPN